MSWQPWVDEQLVGTGKITQGAIIGKQGGIWAATPGFNITPVEEKAVIAAVADPTLAQGQGFTFAGVKYMYLRPSDGGAFLGRKGNEGCAIAPTKQGIVVGVYGPPTPAHEAAIAVEDVAKKLVEINY